MDKSVEQSLLHNREKVIMNIWESLFTEAEKQFFPTEVSPVIYAHHVVCALESGSGMPCGACREFFMQVSIKNKDTEIMVDYDKRKTVKLEDLLPGWWGLSCYETK